MFESAELRHTIDDATYKKQATELRERLLDAQYRWMQKAESSLLILINGVDGAGKGETVNLLNEWMDPRHIQTHGFGPPNEFEAAHPHMWRFWSALPPKGKTAMFFGSWYSAPILQRTYREIDEGTLTLRLEELVRFERMLTGEGALLVKFWFHLSKDQQKKRLKTLEKSKLTRWRVTERDWRHFKHYDEFRAVSERVLRETSTGEAPWTVVGGADPHHRALTVGRVLLDAMSKRLGEGHAPPPSVHVPPAFPVADNVDILRALDVDKRLARAKYDTSLEKLGRRLSQLARHKRFAKRAVACVFEGPDAAGKGGAIRRITGILDARHYRVIPIAAPTEEERAQPYLWRFWRHVPARGRFAMFDRSWYGRVLVERVEKLCPSEAWARAYSEINDFEEQLVDFDILVVKFWLHISQDEQLRRFRERERTRHKRFKITKDDWRNRDKWDAYKQAACDMIDRTSTDIAPWHIVAANDKHHARIKVLDTLCDRIEEVL